MIKLDCNEVSDRILEEIKSEVDKLDRKPGLTVIQVGDNPASTTYVRKKKEKAESLGFNHEQINYPETITEEELLEVIHKINEDETVDGLLVQLPLPKHINEDRIINAISPEKDVDGFSPINVGRLMIGQDCYIPCTPAGILEIIKHFNIQTEGKNVVVFGRSNIVGRPIANLLSQKPWNATVTLCHTKTNDVYYEDIIGCADIIILAVGVANFFNKELLKYVKKNAVIIDVGINRIPDASKKTGFRLCGDFDYKTNSEEWNNDENYLHDFDEWFDDAMYTPVPGGVGVTTICCLMRNTLISYKKREGVV